MVGVMFSAVGFSSAEQPASASVTATARPAIVNCVFKFGLLVPVALSAEPSSIDKTIVECKYSSDSLLTVKNGAHDDVIEENFLLLQQQAMDTAGILMNTVYMYSIGNYKLPLLPPKHFPGELWCLRSRW